jgi:hypothetical protein
MRKDIGFSVKEIKIIIYSRLFLSQDNHPVFTPKVFFWVDVCRVKSSTINYIKKDFRFIVIRREKMIMT